MLYSRTPKCEVLFEIAQQRSFCTYESMNVYSWALLLSGMSFLYSMNGLLFHVFYAHMHES